MESCIGSTCSDTDFSIRSIDPVSDIELVIPSWGRYWCIISYRNIIRSCCDITSSPRTDGSIGISDSIISDGIGSEGSIIISNRIVDQSIVSKSGVIDSIRIVCESTCSYSSVPPTSRIGPESIGSICGIGPSSSISLQSLPSISDIPSSCRIGKESSRPDRIVPRSSSIIDKCIGPHHRIIESVITTLSYTDSIDECISSNVEFRSWRSSTDTHISGSIIDIHSSGTIILDIEEVSSIDRIIGISKTVELKPIPAIGRKLKSLWGIRISCAKLHCRSSVDCIRSIFYDKFTVFSIVIGIREDDMKLPIWIWIHGSNSDISSILDHHLCGLDSTSPGVESISWTSSCYSHIISKGSSSI